MVWESEQEGLTTEPSWTNLRSPSVMVRPLVGVFVPDPSAPESENETRFAWTGVRCKALVRSA